MTKFRKAAIATILGASTLCIGAFALSACKSKDYTVTFNIEGKTQAAEVVDGKVGTMPANPEKDYYTFMGWYTTSDFKEGTEFTKDTEVTADTTVYAYFAPIKVNITVNGGTAENIKLEDLTTEQAEYTATAESQNLTFDGWYVDSGYTTKYTAQSADNLYARYMATVTFNNGYEDVYTYQVKPGTAITKPETARVKKFYMDEEDIYYVYTDENGDVVTEANETTGGREMKEVDFTQTVTAKTNTTFKVIWKTPGLSYSVNSASGNIYVDGGSTADDQTFYTYPVLSIPRKVTYEGETKYVDGIDQLNSMSFMKSLEKIIFQYGVKEILNFNANDNIEEVEIPGSVDMIIDSFFNMDSLKKVTIDEGVKAIYNSFFADNCTENVSIANRTPGKQYAFDIEIPDSVISLCSVPTNFKFSAKSCFTNDGKGRIYQTDGNDKILIADTNVVDGVLTIEDGVTLIQVGAFTEFYARYGLKNLYLPTTWTGVHYNLNYGDYSYDFDDKTYLYKENATAYAVNVNAVAILDCMENMENVVVQASALPDGLSRWTFINNIYDCVTDVSVKAKIVLPAEVTEGESVTVTINAKNTTTGASKSYAINNKKSGETLTEAEVKTAIGATADYYDNFEYTQFGKAYTYGTLNANQYIDVTYSYAAGGFNSEVSGNEVTITGFKQGNTNDTYAKGDAIYNEKTGKYTVVIPAEIDGKKVTKIANEAFKGVEAIEAVYIPSSVKEIGDSAFSGTTSLSTVGIEAGGLEVIGKYAFYNSGFTSIKLPLAKLTSIGEYAFKSQKLQRFYAADGEEKRSIAPYGTAASWYGVSDWDSAVVGQYYFISSQLYLPDNSTNYGCIVKYVNKTEDYTVPGGTDKVTLLDVQLVATAAANTRGELNLGFYFRNYKSSWALSYVHQDVVLRYEVMEGSVYYKSTDTIVFGVVSKIHTNAFTDMGEKYTSTEIGSNGTDYKYNYFVVYVPDSAQSYYQAETWLDAAAVKNLTSDIFEEGWWEGWTATSNAENYAKLVAKMAAATNRAYSE